MTGFQTSFLRERPRVAVIGGGISGLSAAHRLGNDFPVTVFEAEQRLGGHSSTVIVNTPVGEQPIDTGFIVFNDRNYPNFSALLDEIGARHVPSNMSFSVSDLDGRYEYAGSSPNALYATRRNLVRPAFHRMVGDLVRFNNDAKRLVVAGDVDDDTSLRDFLDAGGYSKEFIEKLIVPQVSAVWSADPAQLYSFPARIVFEFFNNHGILELRGRPKWQTIRGGSATYVAKLRAATNAEFHTGTAVEAVRRGEQGVAIKLSDGAEVIFDEVIFATHSDQALDLLVDSTVDEQQVLGAIPYQRNDVVLHSDESLLPRRRAARASWNYHLLDQPRERTTVTYWMNNLQPIAGDQNYMVTLNLTDQIDPASVIKHQSFSHPVFTREGLAAQRRHAEISGVNRTHFCGAYWRWGFHEDGAWSGLRVARMIADAHRESQVAATA
ncbi:MAG: FAD-dependent oxidoreductase [Thermoleophilaceae bacterium]|nr:FAD-dependent oxidoreductase [Thermoleophilaceae bacterium]